MHTTDWKSVEKIKLEKIEVKTWINWRLHYNATV